ncbi:sugar transport protein [Murinocardiopsis flavida]|uniref:Sugar transport protein n=1 Tax=Murinocardiopsis flavida TaxID=645275 RepID=A0A2P8CZ22_9ACTN|nr:sugar transport protein [Murinocardiopsis flavida]
MDSAVTADAANTAEHPPRAKGHVYLVIAVAAIGGLLFGYDTGIAGGAAGFVAEQYRLSGFMEGVVVSAVLVGGAVGALLCGPIADRRGRRPTIIASGLVFALGALM